MNPGPSVLQPLKNQQVCILKGSIQIETPDIQFLLILFNRSLSFFRIINALFIAYILIASHLISSHLISPIDPPAIMSRNAAAGSGSIKDIENKRKQILKPILENPFSSGLEWPVVDAATSTKIMDYLTQLLSRYGNYLEVKRGSHGKHVPEPSEAQKITVGFNSTVKRLEAQAAPNRRKLQGMKAKKQKKNGKNAKGAGDTDNDKVEEKAAQQDSSCSRSSEGTATGYVGYVFVAKADMTTPLLAECFPQLALAASHSSNRKVKLVELPRGAMARLLKILCTENTKIISLCDDWTEAQELFSLIQALVADVAVPWLEQLFDLLQVEYHSLEVAFLQTTTNVGKRKKSQKDKKKDGSNSKTMKGKNQNGKGGINGKRAAEDEGSLAKRTKPL